MKIQGRTFIISGGASGLGLATAKVICSAGGALAILDINEEAWNKTALHNLSADRTRFYTTDVTSSKSISNAVGAVAQWATETGRPLGGVVAAAGIGTAGRIIDSRNNPLSLEAFDFTIAVNLRGTIDLIRQSLPHITQNAPTPPDGGRGVFILVSSIAAFEGQPGQVSYAASKGAIASATLPLARDLAHHGIRVVTIAPSLFESAMTAVLSDKVRQSLEGAMEFPKRAGKPEEFASLAKECIENEMLNGCVIRLDGGTRMPSKL